MPPVPTATRDDLVLPPKVQAPFKAPPGAAPRALLVERKRREYDQRLHDLPRMIAAHTPPGVLGARSSLELRHFDDSELEERTPEEWIAFATPEGASEARLPAVALWRGEYPVPGSKDEKKRMQEEENDAGESDPDDSGGEEEVTDDGTGPKPEQLQVWVPVVVVGYNPTTGNFTVQRRPSDGPVISGKSRPNTPAEASAEAARAGEVKELHRLYICLRVENPSTFARRVGRAHELRREAELAIRCRLYVDCMPTAGWVHATRCSLEAAAHKMCTARPQPAHQLSTTNHQP